MNKNIMSKIIKFGLVGISGVGVNQGILWLLVEQVSLDYKIASIIAIECAIISNFMLNNLWTWQEIRCKSWGQYGTRLLKFNLSSGITALLFNWLTLILLTEYVGIHYLIANIMGIVCAAFFNFIISHYWTFQPKDNSL